MELSELLLLVAVILTAIVVCGGGTMLFCCLAWDSGLPHMSVQDMEVKILDLEAGNNLAAKGLVEHINELSSSLKDQVKELPDHNYVTDTSTHTDLEAATQTNAPVNDVVIEIPE